MACCLGRSRRCWVASTNGRDNSETGEYIGTVAGNVVAGAMFGYLIVAADGKNCREAPAKSYSKANKACMSTTKDAPRGNEDTSGRESTTSEHFQITEGSSHASCRGDAQPLLAINAEGRAFWSRRLSVTAA